MNTDIRILKTTVEEFALTNADTFSMRLLAKKVGVVPSVIYHYFPSKEVLLKSMFDHTNTQLGILRTQLPQTSTAYQMLEQRVEFQLDHAMEVVAVLKYYLTFRSEFKKIPTGFIPDKAYLHIEEVLVRGITDNELDPMLNVQEEAKVMTHAINGFLLEYYPYMPQAEEKQKLIQVISTFLWRGIPKIS